jgi:hypothetical protein
VAQAEERHLSTFDPPLMAAVEKGLKAGHQPARGGNVQWERFCDDVRKDCGKNRADRGYGDRTIKRIVDALKEREQFRIIAMLIVFRALISGCWGDGTIKHFVDALNKQDK